MTPTENRGLWRELYASRWLLLTAPITVICCWLTAAPFFAPPETEWPSIVNMILLALVPVAYVLPSLWRPGPSASALAGQFFKVILGATWPIIGATTLAFIAARLISGTPTEDVPHQPWSDYEFSSALPQHILMAFLFSVLGGLAFLLFVFMPSLAFRRPELVAQGSHLERVGTDGADPTRNGSSRHDGAAPASRVTATRLLWVGLPANILGFVVLIVADGRITPGNVFTRLGVELPRTLKSVARYGLDGDTLLWSLGFVLFAGGILLLLVPLVMVTAVRARDRLNRANRKRRSGR